MRLCPALKAAAPSKTVCACLAVRVLEFPNLMRVSQVFFLTRRRRVAGKHAENYAVFAVFHGIILLCDEPEGKPITEWAAPKTSSTRVPLCLRASASDSVLAALRRSLVSITGQMIAAPGKKRRVRFMSGVELAAKAAR